MTYGYRHLLDPDLYPDCPEVAQFIESLLSPEIDQLSDQECDRIVNSLPSLDDMVDKVRSAEDHAKHKISTEGNLQPIFMSYPSRQNHDMPIMLSSQIPVNKQQVSDLLSAGKCLAFCSGSHSIFFVSEVYHKNGNVLTGKEVDFLDADWGVQVIGSTVTGIGFKSTTTILRRDDNIRFKLISSKFERDRKTTYPFSRFFHIKDELELKNIVRQVKKIEQHLASGVLGLDGASMPMNFAVTLKCIERCDYLK